MTNKPVDPVDEYTDGNSRTKWDLIADLLIAYKRYIGLTFAVIIIAGLLGWIDLPQLEFWHWFAAFSLIGGLTIGASAVLYELADYLTDRRVNVLLAPVQDQIADVIRVPRKTFARMDVVGTRLPDRWRLSGQKTIVARGVDFDRNIIIPAQEFDDEKYPDDLDIIGEDGDGSQVEKYRSALLDDARSYQSVVVDREVIREAAIGVSVQRFAEGMQDIRDGDIQLEDMNDQQIEQHAERIIQQAARQSMDDETGGEGEE